MVIIMPHNVPTITARKLSTQDREPLVGRKGRPAVQYCRLITSPALVDFLEELNVRGNARLADLTRGVFMAATIKSRYRDS